MSRRRMSREWKPGDVARTEVGSIVMRCRGGRWVLHDGYAIDLDVEPRPLVVIDPEDAEQVERLAEELYVSGLILPDMVMDSPDDVGPRYRAGMADYVGNALREFANPTPPPCGTHLAFTRTRPNSRESYTCTLDKDHGGSHFDSVRGISWNGAQV